MSLTLPQVGQLCLPPLVPSSAALHKPLVTHSLCLGLAHQGLSAGLTAGVRGKDQDTQEVPPQEGLTSLGVRTGKLSRGLPPGERLRHPGDWPCWGK